MNILLSCLCCHVNKRNQLKTLRADNEVKQYHGETRLAVHPLCRQDVILSRPAVRTSSKESRVEEAVKGDMRCRFRTVRYTAYDLETHSSVVLLSQR